MFVRSTLRVAGAVVVAMVLYVGLVAWQVRWAGTHDGARSADVIVVMGAAQYDGVPSAMLESRLQHALTLWRDDARAPIIAVTGGKRTGDRFTEAATCRRWLIENGVPPSVIVAEGSGASTWESLRNLAPTLRARGVHSAIIVTTDWHVERSVQTLSDMGFDVSGSPAPSIARSAEWGRWAKEVIGVGVGRLIGFQRLWRITG